MSGLVISGVFTSASPDPLCGEPWRAYQRRILGQQSEPCLARLLVATLVVMDQGGKDAPPCLWQPRQPLLHGLPG